MQNRKGILIISDDPLTTQALGNHFIVAGFAKVLSCIHGEEAYKTFSRERPHYLVVAEYEKWGKGIETRNELSRRKLITDEVALVLLGHGECEEPIFTGFPIDVKEIDRILAISMLSGSN